MIADVQNQNMNAPVMQSQAANQKNLEITKKYTVFPRRPWDLFLNASYVLRIVIDSSSGEPVLIGYI